MSAIDDETSSQTASPPGKAPRYRLLVLLAGLVVTLAVFSAQQWRARGERLTPEQATELGVVYMPEDREEVFSEFSHIRIEQLGTVRTLFFVRDDGTAVVESRMDIARPQNLLVPYTQSMFASHFLLPEPEHVLIIGLGGGSMVRFLEHHQPEVRIDTVEIDPTVIEIADDYFGTRPTERSRIFERDGFEFLDDPPAVYDIIYMDAFLKPSEDTDGSGTHLRLKTRAFIEGLKQRIHPEGLIVFNVNELEDLPLLRDVFEQTYVFQLASPGAVAVGTSASERLSQEQLIDLGRQLDQRFETNFSFETMAQRLAPETWPRSSP